MSMIKTLIVFLTLCSFADSAFAWYRIRGVVYPGHRYDRHHAHERPSPESDKPSQHGKGMSEEQTNSLQNPHSSMEVTRADKAMAISCQYDRSAPEMEQYPNLGKVGQLFMTLSKGTDVVDGCPVILFQTLPMSDISGAADAAGSIQQARKPVVIGVFNLVLRHDIVDCYYMRATANQGSDRGETSNPEKIRCMRD